MEDIKFYYSLDFVDFFLLATKREIANSPMPMIAIAPTTMATVAPAPIPLISASTVIPSVFPKSDHSVPIIPGY